MLKHWRMVLSVLCLLLVCACAGMTYHISDFDAQVSINSGSFTYVAKCRPEFIELKWDPSFRSVPTNSYLYSGKQDSTVVVDRVKLLQGAVNAIDSSLIPACANMRHLTITLLGAKHINDVAPETGVYYVSTQFNLSAKIECGKNKSYDYNWFTGRSKKSKIGFLISTDDIQKALKKSSSEAAVTALFEVLKQCEG